MGLFGSSKTAKGLNSEWQANRQNFNNAASAYGDRSATDYLINQQRGQSIWDRLNNDMFTQGGAFSVYGGGAGGGGGGGGFTPNNSTYKDNMKRYTTIADLGALNEDALRELQGYGKFEAAATGGLRGLMGDAGYNQLERKMLLDYMDPISQKMGRSLRVQGGGAGMGSTLRGLQQDAMKAKMQGLGMLSDKDIQATQWGAQEGSRVGNERTAFGLQGISGRTSMADKINAQNRAAAASRAAADADMFNRYQWGINQLQQMQGGNGTDWADRQLAGLGGAAGQTTARANYDLAGGNKSMFGKIAGGIANLGGQALGAYLGAGGTFGLGKKNPAGG